MLYIGVTKRFELQKPGFSRNQPVDVVAHLQLHRADAMQRNTAKGEVTYQDFLALWKDPNLPIFKQAQGGVRCAGLVAEPIPSTVVDSTQPPTALRGERFEAAKMFVTADDDEAVVGLYDGFGRRIKGHLAVGITKCEHDDTRLSGNLRIS